MELLAANNVIFQGMNLERLLLGMWEGIRISIIAVLIGCILGIIFGILRVKSFIIIKFILRIYLELFRIIPILVWLNLLYYLAAADFGINLDAPFVAIIIFSLWVAAEMSDIVRGSLLSLPKHQSESASALGLTTLQAYQYVLIPQAIKRTIPSTINLITRVIKTTSLLIMLQVSEVLYVGKQIIEVASKDDPMASFWIYGFIFILYFIVCYPLSKIAQRLEKKWAI